ncbi:hypothetical protein JI59_21395 (plasmid) [Novosphingobium pentaromativorans US6-1]|nr:hypothetical protein JI59_21395 [Novosphingobium pentaromativorans US6-1]
MGESGLASDRAIVSDRVVDVDIHGLVAPGEDVHLAWSDLTRGPDLVWTERNGGHWIAVNGDLIRTIYKDKVHFSNRDASLPVPPPEFRLSPANDDGLDHEEARAILAPYFRPQVVAGMAGQVRKLSAELVAKLAPRGSCEFMGEFALVLPVEIFLAMIDLPLADRPVLRALAEQMIRESEEDKRNAGFEAAARYLMEWLDRRAAKPGEDVLSAIATATFRGQPISRQRQLSLALNVLLGGLDSTASMTGFIMGALARDPASRQWFIDHPGQRRQAVEELMRRHGVVNNLRVATCDVELDGVTIRKGEHVYLINALHGLDPRLYPDPLKIDFSRKPQPNAVFGMGDHRCLGANLARMEIGVFLEEWLAKIPDFRIAKGETPVTRSGPVNGMEYLPLEWSPARGAASVSQD